MIPVTITPPPKISLTFKRNNTFALNLEPRPGINLAGSKTITVIQQDGDEEADEADDDNLNLDLALFYTALRL